MIPTNSTRTIEKTVTANQPVVIEHGLGRPVEGWYLVDINKPANVWRSGGNGRKELVLMADQDCVFSVVLL